MQGPGQQFRADARFSWSRAALTAFVPGSHHDGVTQPVVLEQLIQRVVAQLEPEEIWLFGSRAEGRARPDSDYDLLAVLPDQTPEARLNPLDTWKLAVGLGVAADIVPCTRSEFEEEKHEIDTLALAAYLRGKRIYERAA